MHTDTYIHGCLQSPTGAPQPQEGKHVGLVALRYRFCEKYEPFTLHLHQPRANTQGTLICQDQNKRVVEGHF